MKNLKTFYDIRTLDLALTRSTDYDTREAYRIVTHVRLSHRSVNALSLKRIIDNELERSNNIY
jgi:hypothetical protein